MVYYANLQIFFFFRLNHLHKLYFLVLLCVFLNFFSVMLIIYIIVYFISLVFWGFRLLHYFTSRGVTELRFYCFDNVNFYNHQLALYFFINFFLKPYATAYLTYYLLLQFKKNGDFKQLVVHFLYNLIIRLFTGFTKQVIITSFK